VAGTLVQRQQDNGGFTFVELVVVVVMALIVTAAVFQLVAVGRTVFRNGTGSEPAQRQVQVTHEPGPGAILDPHPVRALL
jgi:type II secretory pathway pseudopilin PulG